MCSHWPNCNWCGTTAGSKHIATGPNGTSAGQPPTDDPGDGDDGGDDYGDDGDDGGDGSNGGSSQSSSGSNGGLPIGVPPISRMVKRIRRLFGSNASATLSPDAVLEVAANLPTFSILGGLAGPTTTSDRVVNGTPAAAENPVKTQTQKNTPATATTAKSGSGCTPSPTKSLAPSASK